MDVTPHMTPLIFASRHVVAVGTCLVPYESRFGDGYTHFYEVVTD